MTTAAYREMPPPAGLEALVECLWTARAGPEAEQRPIFPDGCADLIYSHRAGLIYAGTMTRPMASTVLAGEEFQGIRFRPGGARLLLGGFPPPAETGFERAMRYMEQRHGLVDLDRVAFDAGLSPRQFRRRCLEATGVGPKTLCRILRFRWARETAGGGARPNWAELAAGCGFYDQAHLIREFRQFAGQTPAALG